MKNPALINDFDGFFAAAKAHFADRAINDYLRCYAYGTEASCYRYVPKIVLIAQSEDDIATAFALASRYGCALNFRASGTSLSGQSATADVLVIIKFAFKEFFAADEFCVIGAGVIAAQANEKLSALGRKIGPDPATASAALMGGILSNNSSGMCCGVAQNSYQTLQAIRVILPDGALLDTADSASVAAFRQSHAQLLAELSAIREQILADAELAALIRRKFAIKNTTGYSLNAFVDFADPIDILAHLFIGAEGTLGFISRAKMQTIAKQPHIACALLFYERISDAAAAISAFAEKDFLASAEIMDAACLRTAAQLEHIKPLLAAHTEHTAVLVQAEATSADELARKIELINNLAHTNDLLLSTDASEYSLWWDIRKALLPIAAKNRRAGSTVVTEDLCFSVSELANGIEQTQELFKEFGFEHNGVIFGHALAGNIHFIITPDLSDAKEFAAFSGLVEKMARVVAGFKGSIKAEHGTGRMVAPFVELEWGERAYAINRQIKQLIDPLGLCNPDVIISDDKEIFKRNIKQIMPVDERLDACMECGLCQHVCPSTPSALSPRQRIAVLREQKRLLECSDEASRAALSSINKGFGELVDAACAACGMCATACPLGINVAEWTKDYRASHAGWLYKSATSFAQRHHAGALKAATAALRLANCVNNFTLDSLCKRVKWRSFAPRSLNYLPRANDYELPRTAANTTASTAAANTAASSAASSEQPAQEFIYFGSCLNKAFAPNAKLHDSRALAAVALSLAAKAGVKLLSAPKNLCCSKAYESNRAAAAAAISELKTWLESQNAPVIFDHSACSAQVLKKLGSSYLGASGKSWPIYDLVDFCELLLPRLKIRQIDENIAIYLMCAARASGLGEKLRKIACACTSGKIYEEDTKCCAFAGYKGFLQSKINQAALSEFKSFHAKNDAARGFSSSSTCEVGLAHATNMSWQHIAYLLDECAN